MKRLKGQRQEERREMHVESGPGDASPLSDHDPATYTPESLI